MCLIFVTFCFCCKVRVNISEWKSCDRCSGIRKERDEPPPPLKMCVSTAIQLTNIYGDVCPHCHVHYTCSDNNQDKYCFSGPINKKYPKYGQRLNDSFPSQLYGNVTLQMVLFVAKLIHLHFQLENETEQLVVSDQLASGSFFHPLTGTTDRSSIQNEISTMLSSDFVTGAYNPIEFKNETPRIPLLNEMTLEQKNVFESFKYSGTCPEIQATRQQILECGKRGAQLEKTLEGQLREQRSIEETTSVAKKPRISQD